VLGPCAIDQHFGDEHLGLVRSGEMLALPALVVVAGEADAIIEQSDDGNVLTGRRSSSNDCRLIFRHAYGRVRCTLRTVGNTGDVHIGLLEHRRFDEVQAINLLRPRGSRGDTRGSLWTTIEYRADPCASCKASHGVAVSSRSRASRCRPEQRKAQSQLAFAPLSAVVPRAHCYAARGH
jgi:hypothetical protein